MKLRGIIAGIEMSPAFAWNDAPTRDDSGKLRVHLYTTYIYCLIPLPLEYATTLTPFIGAFEVEGFE